MIKFTLAGERKEKRHWLAKRNKLLWTIPSPITIQQGTTEKGQEILTGIISGPLPSVTIVLVAVGHIDVCDLGDKRLVEVGISQQGANQHENLGHADVWRPLVLKDVQVNDAVAADVGVVDFGYEGNLYG